MQAATFLQRMCTVHFKSMNSITKCMTLPWLDKIVAMTFLDDIWPWTYELQMLVQSSRSVARGPVARLVAEGERNSHDWTARKNTLLKAYDEAGAPAIVVALRWERGRA